MSKRPINIQASAAVTNQITINPQNATHTIHGQLNTTMGTTAPIGSYGNGTWMIGPPNTVTGTSISVPKPKSKEEAIDEILSQIETGELTRQDLVNTIEHERRLLSRRKVSQAIESYVYMGQFDNTLEYAEAALIEYDIKKTLEAE